MKNTVTLTPSDIAQMAGVGLSTVSNWRSRHDDFPGPVSGSGSSRRFDADAVRAWLKLHGKKIQELSADSVLWNLMSQWRPLTSVEEAAGMVSAFLVWRAVSDPTSPRFAGNLSEAAQWPALFQHSDDEDLAAAVQTSVREYQEKREDKYRTVFEDLLAQLDGLVGRPDGTTANALKFTLNTINSFKAEELGQIYMAFQDRVTQSLHRGYDDYSTSQDLIDVLVAVSKDIPGSVHDPAVGSGRLLFAVGNHGDDRKHLTGQEMLPNVYRQALQHALVSGQNNVHLELGDVFSTDYFDPSCAQVVVVDPPYAMSYRDHDQLALDHRLPYGTPPRSTIDTAWLQLAIWYLGSNGRAFVIQPSGSSYMRGSADIRANMLKSGTIEAVVSLPAGVAGRTKIPVDLWVLARPGEVADPDKVLLIDRTDQEQLDPEAIAKTLREWRTEGKEPAEKHAGIFTVSDILEKESILTPQRWIAYQDDSVSLESVIADLEALHETTRVLDTVTLDPVALVPAPHTPTLGSVSDLVKAGSVKVLRNRSRRSDADEAENGLPVIDGAWIHGKSGVQQKVDPESLTGEPLITEPGDVVLQNTGGLAARVDDEGGQLVLSPTLHVLRLQDDRFLPEYLAEMLVSSVNRRQAMGAAIQRVRLEDLQIASLSMNDQQQLVTQFDTVRQLQAAAQELLDAASTARDALVDGVTSGVIKIK
ncbi:N-6 DNA methylase [Micrococcoides hystricis]|uniref:N-6 DNA methylase n=1 Tax=Micrococcoides hystricis TaxID=1572761 RepID=A0ABV6PDM8_9MICC